MYSEEETAVSIHAPAWGATWKMLGKDFVKGLVSIHAPAWGATKRLRIIASDSLPFQSTRPRGARPL